MAHEAATAVALTGVAWHMSTRTTNGSGNCVEAGPVRDGSGRVAVRDSKHRTGPVIVCSAAQWAAFLTDIKGGALDPPA